MNMRRTAFVLALAVLPVLARAQGVAINGTGAAADTSAILDLTSTSKGLLPPRMTALQRAAIVTPATGLLVWQSDGTAGLYANTGTPGSPNWQLVGASAASGQWSVSGSNLYYTAGLVGIGSTPVGAYGLTVVQPGYGLRVQTNNTGGAVASFGGVGNFMVDAPGVGGGRLSVLENGNVGLGTATPVNRLDVVGNNGWDVAGGEGDVRIGNGSYRLKFGVATGGGGAGAANIMQYGQPGGYNVLSLGAQGNYVLYVVGSTGFVGIGTNSPDAPLTFPPTLAKKITLYPGSTGDAGFGMSGNRLQVYADNPNADVALGYDAAGTFNERFAFKPNGAMAVMGNTGTAGQVLQSNGSGGAASWSSGTNASYNNTYYALSANGSVTLPGSSPPTQVPDLSITFTVTSTSRVVVNYSVPVYTNSCFACGSTDIFMDVVLDGGTTMRWRRDIGNGLNETFADASMITVGPGTHTVSVVVAGTYGPTTTYGCSGGCALHSTLLLQVMQQ